MAENNSQNLTSVGWPNSKDDYVLAEVIGEHFFLIVNLGDLFVLRWKTWLLTRAFLKTLFYFVIKNSVVF